jgi:hypothetical protein
MPSVHVPFPCVVYTKQGQNGSYRFSHHCEQMVSKCFPLTMRTTDLRAHDPRQNLSAAQRAPFLLLVGGDVAHGVAVSAPEPKARTRFLYSGSAFARPSLAHPSDTLLSELSEHYVSLHFKSTMAVFDSAGKFHAVVPIESGVSLFPRHISEKDIPLLTRWVDACILKSFHTSVWITDGGNSYNEHTMECSPRVK